jgi:hypothetical protein
MTEDQLKQELAVTLADAKSEYTIAVKEVGVEEALEHYDYMLTKWLVNLFTRFSDQRVKEAYDRGVKDAQAAAKLQPGKLGSEAVTPPEQSADGNARGTATKPDCGGELVDGVCPQCVADAIPQSPTSTDAKQGDTNDK